MDDANNTLVHTMDDGKDVAVDIIDWNDVIDVLSSPPPLLLLPCCCCCYVVGSS